MSDRDVARRLRRATGTIYKRRRKLRLAPFRPCERLWQRRKRHCWAPCRPKMARRLKRSGPERGQTPARPTHSILHPKKHRWTPADDKVLSERPDAQVAMLLGISRWPVKHRRRRLVLVGRAKNMFVPVPGGPRRMPCWARPRTGNCPPAGPHHFQRTPEEASTGSPDALPPLDSRS